MGRNNEFDLLPGLLRDVENLNKCMNAIELQIHEHAQGVQNVYKKFEDVEVLIKDNYKFFDSYRKNFPENIDEVANIYKRLEKTENIIKNNYKSLDVLSERLPRIIHKFATEMGDLYYYLDKL